MQVTGSNPNTAYSLSIRLSADGFSFSLHTPSQEEEFSFIPYATRSSISVTANLKNAIASEQILQKSYERVNIILCESRYTVVPVDEFEESRAEELFRYNFPDDDGTVVMFNTLPKNKAVLLFSVNKNAEAMIREQYPNCRFYHQMTPVIEHFYDKSFVGNNTKMFIYEHERCSDIFAFDRGRLLFTNTFPNRETDDSIYYYLFIWKQLAMSQENDEMHLVGTINNRQRLLTELRKYVRKVYLINPAMEFKHLKVAENADVPYDIKTLLLCSVQ